MTSCREKLKKVVKSKRFDSVIFFFIILSSIHLALDSPLNNPKGKLVMILQYIDIALTAIFTFEALLKIYALGWFSS